MTNDLNAGPYVPHEPDEYIVIPEEALQYLPDEWRNELQSIADDGRAVLKSADVELSQLAKILRSMPALMSLKYVQERLANHKFTPDLAWVHEIDMLTSAFVVAYARLHRGDAGSGFSREALPQRFREEHDRIIELRNKRFAHTDIHHSVAAALEVGFQNNRFEIGLNLNMGYQVGGHPDWPDLVKAIDELMYHKLDRLVTKLREKTGREWALPSGPPPE